MKNADKPINAIRGATNVPFDNDGFLESSDMIIGLTKREHFAGLAMQGSLAVDVENTMTITDIAEQAVTMADALLAELEKPVTQK